MSLVIIFNFGVTMIRKMYIRCDTTGSDINNFYWVNRYVFYDSNIITKEELNDIFPDKYVVYNLYNV